MTAAVNWLVEANPPRSRVLVLPSDKTLLIARVNCFDSLTSPTWFNISAPLSSMAVGLAKFRPVKKIF